LENFETNFKILYFIEILISFFAIPKSSCIEYYYQMLQVEKATNPVALAEFEVEMELLSRLNHSNIIRILGAGMRPRPYIILERLRDVNVLLGLNQPDGNTSAKAFSFMEVLQIAKDLADALDYIHTKVHHDVMILHRDLKPENLGLSPEGRLKLFDFGLCRCVRKRLSESDAYEMTGNTGSLRYMAPEVVLNKPYTEKVDVFSFAVVIWTIARGRLPYKGYDRAMHRTRVVIGGERPKIDGSWPAPFNELLEQCWHTEATRRPTMAEVSQRLTQMLENRELTAAKPVSGPGSILRKLSNAFSRK
jgi:serine/threonine protein kinase